MIGPKNFFSLAALPIAITCLSNPLTPNDVNQYLRDLETCEHLAGEFNPDLGRKERRAFIESANWYCAKAHYERRMISQKYKGSANVARWVKSETLDSFSPSKKLADVGYTCDPASSYFSIASYPSVANERGKAHIVDGAGLTRFGPRTHKWGDPLRAGSRTVEVSCGKLQIRLQVGYLNEDPHGPSGSRDFPVVEVRTGSRVLLTRTAISACETADPRTANFGACPAHWAEAVDVRATASGKFEVDLKRKFSDADDVEQEIEVNLLR